MCPDSDREMPIRRAHGGDVRQRGFPDRASVDEAIAWVDRHTPGLSFEEVRVEQARGRIPKTPWSAPADLPATDCACVDGYAVRSAETIGAGNYNPLRFRVQEHDGPLLPGSVALVASGEALPQGADAVLPFEAVQAHLDALDVSSPVAPGTGIARKAEQVRAGSTLLESAQPLRPQDLGLLASLGLKSLQVVRRPRVQLAIAGPKPGRGSASGDADGPMLAALVARDGGIVDTLCADISGRDALARAIAGSRADLVLVAGRTATGMDDESPLALAAAGEVAIHGIALRPGGSAGMGRVGATPAFLLPGDPLACLCAYDLFPGRMIRGLSGRDPGLPYPVGEFELRRKIVSAVGLVDWYRVRLVGGGVEPLGGVESGGLASAVRADGFVLVPASLEGYPPGKRVTVHLYREAH
jgi:molybdopterin molybdotransferase